jgi:hypothetical protein
MPIFSWKFNFRQKKQRYMTFIVVKNDSMNSGITKKAKHFCLAS